MTKKEFLYNLTEEYGTAEFTYNGKKCGVEPETTNSITVYTMWYGKKWKDYNNIDKLMTDKFFDGLSLNEILSSVDMGF